MKQIEEYRLIETDLFSKGPEYDGDGIAKTPKQMQTDLQADNTTKLAVDALKTKLAMALNPHVAMGLQRRGTTQPGKRVKPLLFNDNFSAHAHPGTTLSPKSPL